ncbi:hypothetical protein CODIS_41860 [Candidatus Thiodiazotropha endolucinida]|uniref:Uncharacterized protein n=1 Tax=Candidatus Thiodiazotropha endolucinida TaxID=1655433 RepID=A0A7Z0VHV1_9GAMM|nr:hypothetical protein CODIS_41860 [Candidatus Thiodiazotropha endolucinida]
MLVIVELGDPVTRLGDGQQLAEAVVVERGGMALRVLDFGEITYIVIAVVGLAPGGLTGAEPALGVVEVADGGQQLALGVHEAALGEATFGVECLFDAIAGTVFQTGGPAGFVVVEGDLPAVGIGDAGEMPDGIVIIADGLLALAHLGDPAPGIVAEGQ